MDLEAFIAQIVADYAATQDPTREQAWIAEVNGRRVGCVSCVRKDNATAQLRILLVTDEGRGRGLGRRLVQQCIDFARAAGYQKMVLWTNDPLAAARHLYLEAGFRLTDEGPHHSFGVDLVGQSYQLDLTSLPSLSPRR
jgi:GNAT superfamily N-acetyltransferase